MTANREQRAHPGWRARTLDRRALLRRGLLGGAGLAAALLFGCGGDDDDIAAAPPAAAAWGYSGPRGPEHWASLSEAYSACAGEEQSPVDIRGYEQGGGGPLSFSYGGDASAVRNDGMFVHVDFAEGNTLHTGERTFGAEVGAPARALRSIASRARNWRRPRLHLVQRLTPRRGRAGLAVVGAAVRAGRIPAQSCRRSRQSSIAAVPAGESTASEGITLNADADLVPGEPGYYQCTTDRRRPLVDVRRGFQFL